MNMSGPESDDNSQYCKHASRCLPRLPSLYIPQSIRNLAGNILALRPGRLLKMPRLFGVRAHAHHVPSTADDDFSTAKECYPTCDEPREPISIDLEDCESIAPLEMAEDELLSPVTKSPTVLTFKMYYKEDSPLPNAAYFVKPPLYSDKSIRTAATFTSSKVSSFSEDAATCTDSVPNNTSSCSSDSDEETKLRDSLRVRHFMRIASVHGHRILA